VYKGFYFLKLFQPVWASTLLVVFWVNSIKYKNIRCSAERACGVQAWHYNFLLGTVATTRTHTNPHTPNEWVSHRQWQKQDKAGKRATHTYRAHILTLSTINSMSLSSNFKSAPVCAQDLGFGGISRAGRIRRITRGGGGVRVWKESSPQSPTSLCECRQQASVPCQSFLFVILVRRQRRNFHQRRRFGRSLMGDNKQAQTRPHPHPLPTNHPLATHLPPSPPPIAGCSRRNGMKKALAEVCLLVLESIVVVRNRRLLILPHSVALIGATRVG